jgi:hypothetical protein
MTDLFPGKPQRPFREIGIRSLVALNEQSPQKSAGSRREHRRSVPIAIGTHFDPTRAESPPDDPPLDRPGRLGWFVCPVMLFRVSAARAPNDYALLTTGIAPALRSALMRGASLNTMLYA